MTDIDKTPPPDDERISNPLRALEGWLADAKASGAPTPTSVAFVTVGTGGRPSARTVSLKRIDFDTLVFTSALWTRKAHEMQRNPNVALLFYWPLLGRQVHITGRAVHAERALANELFGQRDLPQPTPNTRFATGNARRRSLTLAGTARPSRSDDGDATGVSRGLGSDPRLSRHRRVLGRSK